MNERPHMKYVYVNEFRFNLRNIVGCDSLPFVIVTLTFLKGEVITQIKNINNLYSLHPR